MSVIDSLQAEIHGFRTQLEQVLRLLVQDPQNEALIAVKQQMNELIELKTELLQEELRKQSRSSVLVPPPGDAGVTGGVRLTAPDQGRKRTFVPKSLSYDAEGRLIIPEKLQIKPTDTEEQRAAKKKKIHLLKSAARQQKLEEESKQQQSSWQKFAQRKSVAKVVRKESIFRSSESGRVGVTGSGRPMTEFTDRGTFRGLAHTDLPMLPAQGGDEEELEGEAGVSS